MIEVKEAKGLKDYRLSLKFNDGCEGQIDYSYLVGNGVFAIWNDPVVFQQVKISKDGRSIYWNENVDMCADALYLKAVS